MLDSHPCALCLVSLKNKNKIFWEGSLDGVFALKSSKGSGFSVLTSKAVFSAISDFDVVFIYKIIRVNGFWCGFRVRRPARLASRASPEPIQKLSYQQFRTRSPTSPSLCLSSLTPVYLDFYSQRMLQCSNLSLIPCTTGHQTGDRRKRPLLYAYKLYPTRGFRS